MRISDWSSDVCSSDLRLAGRHHWSQALLPDLDGRVHGRLDSLRHVDLLADADRISRTARHRRWRAAAGLAIDTRRYLSCRPARPGAGDLRPEIGRASCREGVCQFVWITVVAVSLKKKTKNQN